MAEASRGYHDIPWTRLSGSSGLLLEIQRGKVWEPAVVRSAHVNLRSYLVQSQHGQLRRNRRHLSKTDELYLPVFQLGHFPRAQRPALIYMRPVPFVLRPVSFISALSFSSSLVQLPVGLNCLRQLNSSVLASHWLETIVSN